MQQLTLTPQELDVYHELVGRSETDPNNPNLLRSYNEVLRLATKFIMWTTDQTIPPDFVHTEHRVSESGKFIRDPSFGRVPIDAHGHGEHHDADHKGTETKTKLPRLRLNKEYKPEKEETRKLKDLWEVSSYRTGAAPYAKRPAWFIGNTFQYPVSGWSGPQPISEKPELFDNNGGIIDTYIKPVFVEPIDPEKDPEKEEERFNKATAKELERKRKAEVVRNGVLDRLILLKGVRITKNPDTVKNDEISIPLPDKFTTVHVLEKAARLAVKHDADPSKF